MDIIEGEGSDVESPEEKGLNARLRRIAVEEEENWLKWSHEIPGLVFPIYMRVRILPPTGGATVRFRVSHIYDDSTDVSIYLDCNDQLGIVGKPYWEVYPVSGDTHRLGMHDTQGLIETIELSLKQQMNGE